jgi:predicted dinucleotide-binding enzyme
MKIGLIGAGEIGGTLTRRLGALGHEVAVANSRGPETLAELASETGAQAVTAAAAAKGRDLVIFTIPMKNVPQHRGVFSGVPAEVVVIDTCNYYPRQRDGRIEPIEAGMTEARWVSTELGRPTVRRSTTSTGRASSTMAVPRATPRGSPCRSPGMMRAPRRR